MFKPRTVNQFKVYRFIKERFALDHFLISPLSRSALLLEDRTGDKLAFAFQDGDVREIEIPAPPAPDAVRTFWQQFRILESPPRMKDFDDITVWWMNHSNPLTYQMALNLPDDLYQHFLTHPILEDKAVYQLAEKGLVTEAEYLDVLLWYRNGNFRNHWLGPLGLDGTGNIYGLIRNYEKPNANEIRFYLLDDYYCYMNHLPE
ncbi:hypothetical protein DS742_17510 [Lacrimispora amygdalina]|uniref:Uncharacterized protein n=1 Tax=Lacrimispora amygdalina TaxID=253257 RepID=A0A3E2N9D3_9FIRM|nr:hypothetical protein [Clostridium indicum]RFZ77613.1 hypothetical protein DS742_17510 [Clostridium indicum]